MGSLRYRGPPTWEIVPDNIKESTSLDISKSLILRMFFIFILGWEGGSAGWF